jgi:hypothetical protein
MERVIYHWWANESDPKEHWKNLRSPIILAIATLRAQNPDIQIDVLDCTEFEEDDVYFDWLDGRSQDGSSSMPRTPKNCLTLERFTRWGEYPFKLGFNVWHQEPHLKKYHSDKAGYKHLSRIFDLQSPEPYAREFSVHSWGTWEVPEDLTVIYSDADVFWLRDPLPLNRSGDQFCFDGFNTGFFYYKPISKTISKFFEIFSNYTITALNNETFRKELKKHVGYDDWYYVFDEMTLSYMFHEHQELFSQIFVAEHCTVRQFSRALNMNAIKMLHANGAMMHNHLAKHAGEKEHCRGLLCLIWREFWDSISSVLSDNDIAEIFTPEELAYYKPRQYSLRDDWQRVIATKQSSGSFHIHKSLTANLI